MSFEMNEEQKRMFDALAPLAQKVCINVIAGMSNIDAYKEAGGKAKTKGAQESGVSEILSNPKVKSFMDSMKGESLSRAIMSRDEMMERLTALASINMQDLINARPDELTELKAGYDLKLKAALGAMKQLADLTGYNEKQKVELSGVVGSVNYDVKSSDPKEAAQEYLEMLKNG